MQLHFKTWKVNLCFVKKNLVDACNVHFSRFYVDSITADVVKCYSGLANWNQHNLILLTSKEGLPSIILLNTLLILEKQQRWTKAHFILRPSIPYYGFSGWCKHMPRNTFYLIKHQYTCNTTHIYISIDTSFF